MKVLNCQKRRFRKKNTLRKKKIPTKRKLRNSPVLQGVLIGIVVVVIFWGIFGVIFSQGFNMTNNALSPDVNQGDLMLYERIPFNEIKVGDIIAFVPSERSEFSNKVGKVRNVFINLSYVETSNNVNPNSLERVDENEFVGKITNVVSDMGNIGQVFNYPFNILITGILLVSSIVILKIIKLDKFNTRF